jgi:uncharacterized protein (DUF3084 family)
MSEVAVIASGLGLLVALAAVAGSLVDRRARDAAWRHIAAARRANHDKAAELNEWEIELYARSTGIEARERRLTQREQALGAREDAVGRRERDGRVHSARPPT